MALFSSINLFTREIAGAAGFEPTAYGLENRCSIRLSYSPILLAEEAGIEPTFAVFDTAALAGLSYSSLY